MLHLFRSSRVKYASLFALALAPASAVAVSCAAGGKGGNSDFNTDASSNAPGSGGFDASNSELSLTPPPPVPGLDGSAGCDGGACADFPAMPVVDTTAVPANVATLFAGDGASGTTTGGPCLSEPADGALVPYNWLRPRVFWAPGAGQTVFEVRIHSALETNDYVVYTTNNYWTMDKPTWEQIAGGTVNGVPGTPGHLVGQDVTVVVRGTTASGSTPAISNTATFHIAPALAAGALVFWSTASFATTSTSTNLQGFTVGDEGTTTVLTPPQVAQQVLATPPDGGNLQATLQPVQCIGCHTATPDGLYVGFTAQWPWPNALASVQVGSSGAQPPWLSPGAIENLSPNVGFPAVGNGQYLGGGFTTATNNIDNVMLGTQTFSAAHYTTGDRIEIAQLGNSLDQPDNSGGVEQPIQLACQGGGPDPCSGGVVTSQLSWINLEWAGSADAGRPSAAPAAPNNGGWGVLARTGDSNSAGTPNWSNNGTWVAYTSAPDGTMDGRLEGPVPAGPAPAAGAPVQAAVIPPASADIKWIPYNANNPPPGGAGGPATSLAGASDPTLNEYFPAFSPDDALIAFNSVPVADSMYNQPLAELYVVPFNGGKGGTAVKLVANDPVACTGVVSPGVQNTWPKWAPNPKTAGDAGVVSAQTVGGLTYYWVTFSSTRSATSMGKEQLYVAGITVDSMGNIKTYAPIYLWNQSDTVNNLIPSWGEFSLPPPTIMPPPPPLPPPPQ
jgi:hypothetical protein